MHPRCRQVPPTLSFSTDGHLDSPADAAYSAAAYPPGPPPMTTRSNCSAVRDDLSGVDKRAHGSGRRRGPVPSRAVVGAGTAGQADEREAQAVRRPHGREQRTSGGAVEGRRCRTSRGSGHAAVLETGARLLEPPTARSVKLGSGIGGPVAPARPAPLDLADRRRPVTDAADDLDLHDHRRWPTALSWPEHLDASGRLRSEIAEELDPARRPGSPGRTGARPRSASGCSRRRRLRTPGARPVVALVPGPTGVDARVGAWQNPQAMGLRDIGKRLRASVDELDNVRLQGRFVGRSSNRSKGCRCARRRSGSAARSPGCASRPARARRRSRSPSATAPARPTVVFTGRRARRHGAQPGDRLRGRRPRASGASTVLLNPAYTLLP